MEGIPSNLFKITEQVYNRARTDPILSYLVCSKEPSGVWYLTSSWFNKPTTSPSLRNGCLFLIHLRHIERGSRSAWVYDSHLTATLYHPSFRKWNNEAQKKKNFEGYKCNGTWAGVSDNPLLFLLPYLGCIPLRFYYTLPVIVLWLFIMSIPHTHSALWTSEEEPLLTAIPAAYTICSGTEKTPVDSSSSSWTWMECFWEWSCPMTL